MTYPKATLPIESLKVVSSLSCVSGFFDLSILFLRCSAFGFGFAEWLSSEHMERSHEETRAMSDGRVIL